MAAESGQDTAKAGDILLTMGGVRTLEWIARKDGPSPLLDVLGISPFDDDEDPALQEGMQSLVASGLAVFEVGELELAPAVAAFGVVLADLTRSVLLVSRGEAELAVRIAECSLFRVLLTAQPPGVVRVEMLSREPPLVDIVCSAIEDGVGAQGVDSVLVAVEMPAASVLEVELRESGLHVSRVSSSGGPGDVYELGGESGGIAVRQAVIEALPND